MLINKKVSIFISGIIIAFLISGCNPSTDSELNELGGYGKLQYSERTNGINAVYDNENIYFSFANDTLLRLESNELLTVNCMIASCRHDTGDCEALLNFGELFVFNDKLYEYCNESELQESSYIYNGYIKEYSTDKIVFENPIPNELDEGKKIDDSTQVMYVRVINDDYVKVEGRRHAYILDKEFNIVCWYDDVGKFPWGTLYENNYYYINDIFQLMCINLETGISEAVESDEKYFLGGADGEYLFYSNEFSELYRYSLEDGSRYKVSDGVMFFSVYDGYIYCQKNLNGTQEKLILNYEGNIVKDYSNYTNMGMDNLIKINGRMYNVFEQGVAMMNEDGTGYKEVLLQ